MPRDCPYQGHFSYRVRQGIPSVLLLVESLELESGPEAAALRWFPKGFGSTFESQCLPNPPIVCCRTHYCTPLRSRHQRYPPFVPTVSTYAVWQNAVRKLSFYDECPKRAVHPVYLTQPHYLMIFHPNACALLTYFCKGK